MINNIEQYHELIWQKIDGNLSVEAQHKFDILMQDKRFADYYTRQLQLHKALSDMPVQPAPSKLLDNIMASVGNPQLSGYDLPDFKKLFLPVVGLMIIVSVIYGLFATPAHTSTGGYAFMDDLLSGIRNNAALPDTLNKVLPYSMALLAATGLVWLDNFYKGKARVGKLNF